jgi:hypothetical protein
MSEVQMVSCDIALGGDRNNVVHRGERNPIAYPEVLVLKLVHSINGVPADDVVTNIVEVKRVPVNVADLRTKMREKYGAKALDRLFPQAIADAMIPLSDDTLPTLEDVAASKAASDAALAARRAKPASTPMSKPKKTAAAAAPILPETTVAPAPILPETADASGSTIDLPDVADLG